jgi:integrase
VKPRTNEAKWIEAEKRWQILVQRDGKRRPFVSSRYDSPDPKGKIEAERKADKWLETGNKKDIRFAPAYAAFVEDKKQQSSNSSDWKKHDSIGRAWLLPACKYKRLSSITNQDWQDCINKAYKLGRSKKTIMNIRASITCFYKYAKKNKWPMEKPEDITIPRDAPVMERKILQPDQLHILFTVDTIRHHTRRRKCFDIYAWRFQVLTGLRPGEIAGLEWSTDIQNQLLRINRAINNFNEQTGGKNDRARRSLVMVRQAREVLDAQRRMLDEMGIKTKWVFPDIDGGPMNPKSSYGRWDTYRHQNGITSSLYELRHSMISYGKALPEQLMKRVVGHGAGMPTYGTYGHEVDGDLLRASQQLEEIFDKLLPSGIH